MKNYILPILSLVTATLAWAVPSEINYQGRLTDANGDAVTGDVSMSLKMFDAATDGNEIYSEDIGTVTLDDNGVYSFQFGASGQSVVDREDTIAVADGSATRYTGSVSSTPLSGTLSVADGTYSWNIADGNPGQQATATAQLVNGFIIGITVTNGGEGYTEAPVVTIDGNGTDATATAVVEDGVLTAINVGSTGSGYTNATVSIDTPPAPYVVTPNYSAGTVTVTYESAPTAGTEIVASYEANDSSIVGALSAADAHWLELSVDGTAQAPRERVLSVPFAQVAGRLSSENRIDSRVDSLMGKLAHLINGNESVQFNLELDTGEIFVGGRILSKTFDLSNKYFRSVTTTTSVDGNSYAEEIRIFNYEDGESHQDTFTGYSGTKTVTNPYPNKRVASFTYNTSSRGHFINSIIAVSVEEDEQVESVNFGKTLTAGDWIFGFEQTDLLNSTEYDYEFRCVDASGSIFAILSSQGQRIRLEADTVCSSVEVVWSAKDSPTVVSSNSPAISSISFVQAD
jgi:hypothetical protein